MAKGYHDSQTPEAIRDLWQTPRFVFDYYDRRFNFTTDVAASIENRLCNDFRCEKWCDGLLTGWGDRNWCNNPYSDIGPWVAKATKERDHGRMSVMLLPADTSVKWFADALRQCSECHLISGRLSYINAETGKPVSGNNKGSAVFIFDPLSPLRSKVVMIDRDSMVTP